MDRRKPIERGAGAPPRFFGKPSLSAVDQFAAAFVTLIVVVEPFGLAPIFLAATRAMALGSRAGIAARASLSAF